jgi:hypothetical protein
MEFSRLEISGSYQALPYLHVIRVSILSHVAVKHIKYDQFN